MLTLVTMDLKIYVTHKSFKYLCYCVF